MRKSRYFLVGELFIQIQLAFPHSNFYKGTRARSCRLRSTHISFSLSFSLSCLLSFFVFIVCLLLLTCATTNNFVGLKILNLNSFSREERVLKGFELERISIVKSLCPCSFSRDDDSSFWRDDGYMPLFSRAKGRRGMSAFCSLCVYARVCCCIHQFSLQFLNSSQNFDTKPKNRSIRYQKQNGRIQTFHSIHRLQEVLHLHPEDFHPED